jgi:hypothetical protein
MANKPGKYNPVQSNRRTTKTDADTLKENWEVMKPFVRFGFKAIVILGGALINIVKLIPDLLEERKEEPKKGGKIIKI